MAALTRRLTVLGQGTEEHFMETAIKVAFASTDMKHGAEISELLEALQAELRSGPSAWLAQAIKRLQAPNAQRFDSMEAEGWDE